MDKLVPISTSPEFSNSEIEHMLKWLACVAADESEPVAARRDACIASLSLAELFEIHEGTCDILATLYLLLKDFKVSTTRLQPTSTRKPTLVPKVAHTLQKDCFELHLASSNQRIDNPQLHL